MYDALLVVSFGGPEGPDDVMPFLENVLRGKNVPRERMVEVSKHYQKFGGISPINDQCRALIDAIKKDFAEHDFDMPIYWGNRNWSPFLPDTIQQMADDGIKKACAFFTSTFSCYSGCRQYRENIIAAREQVGEAAPIVEKLRMPFNHPKFIGPQTEILKRSLASVPDERRSAATVLFCAHSIPMLMADNCNYERQLRETAGIVASEAGHEKWELVFQSRSGPPQQPWLEPDICDRIEELKETEDVQDIVAQPIGFVSDHMEVMYDLDEEAAEICEEKGIHFVRSPTIGLHSDFVSMVRDLIVERSANAAIRPAIGDYGPSHDVCPKDCCLYPVPARRPT
jgi:ferrochelatase